MSCMSYMSNMSYMTYLTCMVLWHTPYVCMLILVSKEELGPQECSQPSLEWVMGTKIKKGPKTEISYFLIFAKPSSNRHIQLNLNWVTLIFTNIQPPGRTSSETDGLHNQSLAGKMSQIFKVSCPKKVSMTPSSLTQCKTKSIKKKKKLGPDPAQPCKVPDFWFSNTW